jgi:hypothetical protein
MVDAADLKSASCKGVWVRVPPSAVNQAFCHIIVMNKILRPDKARLRMTLHSVIARHDSAEAIPCLSLRGALMNRGDEAISVR